MLLLLVVLVLLALSCSSSLWLALLWFALPDGRLNDGLDQIFVGNNNVGEASCGGIGGAPDAGTAVAAAALTAGGGRGGATARAA